MMNNDISLHPSTSDALSRSAEFRFNVSKPYLNAKTIPSSYYSDSSAYDSFEQTSPTQDRLTLSSKKSNLRLKTEESLITEIIIPLSSGNQNDVVLPMLAHLSQQVENRWFTWITCSKLTIQELCKYNFAQEKVRIIRANSEREAHWLMWEALHNGTSGTVVSDTGKISSEVRSHLNQAAKHGASRAILLSELL